MISAKFGFLSYGSCHGGKAYDDDKYFLLAPGFPGCEVDILPNTHRLCTGKSSCDLFLSMFNDTVKISCLGEHRDIYLEASFVCIPGR